MVIDFCDACKEVAPWRESTCPATTFHHSIRPITSVDWLGKYPWEVCEWVGSMPGKHEGVETEKRANELANAWAAANRDAMVFVTRREAVIQYVPAAVQPPPVLVAEWFYAALTAEAANA